MSESPPSSWYENIKIARAVMFLVLLLSPVGAPAIWLFLEYIEVCRGGFDTPVACAKWVPFQGYLDAIASIWGIAALVGIGLVWMLIAALLPFAILWNLYHGIREQRAQMRSRRE